MGGIASARWQQDVQRLAPESSVMVQQVGLQEDDICLEFLKEPNPDIPEELWMGRFEVTFTHCDNVANANVKRTIFDDGSGWDGKGRVFCAEQYGYTPGLGERRTPKWADDLYQKRHG